jgi:hypothetical protein
MHFLKKLSSNRRRHIFEFLTATTRAVNSKSEQGSVFSPKITKTRVPSIIKNAMILFACYFYVWPRKMFSAPNQSKFKNLNASVLIFYKCRPRPLLSLRNAAGKNHWRFPGAIRPFVIENMIRFILAWKFCCAVKQLRPSRKATPHSIGRLIGGVLFEGRVRGFGLRTVVFPWMVDLCQ